MYSIDMYSNEKKNALRGLDVKLSFSDGFTAIEY